MTQFDFFINDVWLSILLLSKSATFSLISFPSMYKDVRIPFVFINVFLKFTIWNIM